MRSPKNIVPFNASGVKKAIPIDDKRTEYRIVDGPHLIPGLILEVFPSGRMSWRILLKHTDPESGQVKYQRKTIGNASTPLKDIRRTWRYFYKPSALEHEIRAYVANEAMWRMVSEEYKQACATQEPIEKRIADKYIPRRD